MAEGGQKRRSWFRHWQYVEGRDSPTEVRNVLLVLAALIAAVTFQAGVNPPGGVWQDTKDGKDGHEAGRAIYASNQLPYGLFLAFNTMALSSTFLIILSITHRFPFHVEIWIAAVSMAVSYASAVVAVTPHKYIRFRWILLAAAVPLIIRFFLYYLNREGEDQLLDQNPRSDVT